jgi:hypothetical protein
MDAASPELIAVVRDDLSYLVNDWPGGEIRDDEIRRSSAVLRRLFNYRDLVKVWVTVVGKQDFLVPSSFIHVADINRLREVNFATSSPAQNVGMKIFAAMEFNKIQEGPAPVSIKEEVAPLKRYLNQPACVISGVLITREELVQFVANKLGGAHFDDGRDKPNERVIQVMTQYVIGNRPALIHEMLSCGQVLAGSESTKELIGALRK